MKVSLFTRLFPPPKYLAQPIFGLDISDQSIKCADLYAKEGNLAVRHLGERSLKAGVLDAGQIKDQAVLVEKLQSLKKEFKMEAVAASLPEEQAFTVRLALPRMKRRELRQSIELQLEEYVPLPAADIVFDYEAVPLTKKPELLDVAISVLPRRLVLDYSEAIKSAGLSLQALEIEAQSVARALLPTGSAGTHLIVDIGKIRTGFFVIERGIAVFTSTINNIGGEDITKSIQKNLKVTYEEAERQKIEIGLIRTKAHQELFFSLVPVVATLRDEIGKLYNYWNSHRDEQGLPRQKIASIILCGGQATLPGLVEYLGASLEVPVTLGNPWVNIYDEKVLPPLERNNSLRYTTALGLALRSSVILP